MNKMLAALQSKSLWRRGLVASYGASVLIRPFRVLQMALFDVFYGYTVGHSVLLLTKYDISRIVRHTSFEAWQASCDVSYLVSEILLGQLSTAVPMATLDMALQKFRGCGVEVVDEHALSNRTVQHIVSELTKFLGIRACEIAPSSFTSDCAEKVMEVIRSQVLRCLQFLWTRDFMWPPRRWRLVWRSTALWNHVI